MRTPISLSTLLISKTARFFERKTGCIMSAPRQQEHNENTTRNTRKNPHDGVPRRDCCWLTLFFFRTILRFRKIYRVQTKKFIHNKKMHESKEKKPWKKTSPDSFFCFLATNIARWRCTQRVIALRRCNSQQHIYPLRVCPYLVKRPRPLDRENNDKCVESHECVFPCWDETTSSKLIMENSHRFAFFSSGLFTLLCTRLVSR